MCRLPQDLYDRTCAFVRTMAATCRGCMRPKYACDTCDLWPAKALLGCLEDARKPRKNRVRFEQLPYETRERFYAQEIRKAGRWVTAREIDKDNALRSGRGLKYWTLRKMVKRGILKTYCDGKDVYFSTTTKETT